MHNVFLSQSVVVCVWMQPSVLHKISTPGFSYELEVQFIEKNCNMTRDLDLWTMEIKNKREMKTSTWIMNNTLNWKCKPEFDVKVDSLESALIKKVCYISDPDSQL